MAIAPQRCAGSDRAMDRRKGRRTLPLTILHVQSQRRVEMSRFCCGMCAHGTVKWGSRDSCHFFRQHGDIADSTALTRGCPASRLSFGFRRPPCNVHDAPAPCRIRTATQATRLSVPGCRQHPRHVAGRRRGVRSDAFAPRKGVRLDGLTPRISLIRWGGPQRKSCSRLPGAEVGGCFSLGGLPLVIVLPPLTKTRQGKGHGRRRRRTGQ